MFLYQARAKTDGRRHTSTTHRQETYFETYFDNYLADALWGPPYRSHIRVNDRFYEISTGSDDSQASLDLSQFSTVEEALGTNTLHIRGQCRFCFTEYEVHENIEGWNGVVEIAVWHDLGNGRSKDGIFWETTSHWSALVGSANPYNCAVQLFPWFSIRNAYEEYDGSRLP